MNATRRLSLAALVVACLHLVFGAIVRISGSGMGCGDNWPKCYGYWFPPFNRPDLVVEVSHRYLASILTLTVLSLAFVAFRNRGVAGVGGKGGAMRSAFGAVGAVFTAAILGGVTVKMGNAPWATVAHWLVAMTLLAMVATTAIRAGALGGASARVQRGSLRAMRSGRAAAGMAIFAVALGGLTAKLPGAAVACTTVPMCGPNPAVEASSRYVQMTHRTIAVLLVLHLLGMVMMVRKRRDEEAPVVVKATYIAFGMVVAQLVVASAMILGHLPPVLRSLHEATGVGIWLSCFVLAYLAHRSAAVASSRATLSEAKGSRGTVVQSSDPSTPALRASARDDGEGQALHASARDDGEGTALRASAQDDSEGQALRASARDDSEGQALRASARDDGEGQALRASARDDGEGQALRASAREEDSGEIRLASEPAPVILSAAKDLPIEVAVADASVVVPVVAPIITKADELAPPQLPPTMAVIVARGADLL